MSNKAKTSYLILPAIPIVAFLIYFIIKNAITPTTKENIKEHIKSDYEKNKIAFDETIIYLKNSNSVWAKYEIYFHPGLGTKFYGLGFIDTTKISYHEYKNTYCKNIQKGVGINYYPDFHIDENILSRIKSINISKIQYLKDSTNISIKFLYKYRTFNPADYDYFIEYKSTKDSNKNVIPEKLIWKDRLNDSIFFYAVEPE